MKIKLDVSDNKDCMGLLIRVLPALDFWYSGKTCCIAVGWLVWDLEFWFGDIAEMV